MWHLKNLNITLQRMIKRTLGEIGCPSHIIDDLMENCHERRWPRGLSSLETRQNNRRQYENYVCKRVPGKQAVLVLSCDNTHMGEDMMVEPGLVMIFAHGIEWNAQMRLVSCYYPTNFHWYTIHSKWRPLSEKKMYHITISIFARNVTKTKCRWKSRC